MVSNDLLSQVVQMQLLVDQTIDFILLSLVLKKWQCRSFLQNSVWIRFLIDFFDGSLIRLLSLAGASDDKSSEVCYLQSQNGNLHSADSLNGVLDDTNISEFEPLTHDVPKDISWCTEALGSILSRLRYSMSTQFRQDTCLRQSTYGSGTERALRVFITVQWMIFVCILLLIATQDPYENIYTVVRGMKHFFLLPPTDGWCLKGKWIARFLRPNPILPTERYYPHATYTRQHPSERLEITPSSNDIPKVRWSSISNPENLHTLPPEILPIRVTLMPGETLYLPVGWWHYVRQSGITVALNWWYDAELRGMSWVMLNFLRNPVEISPVNDDDDKE